MPLFYPGADITTITLMGALILPHTAANLCHSYTGIWDTTEVDVPLCMIQHNTDGH